MANEITVLQGRRGGQFTLVYYYPIPPGQRINQRDATGAVIANTPVVPAHSSLLPGGALLPPAEIAALDTGEALFITRTMTQGESETDGQFLARVQADYNGRTSILLARYQERFRHAGKKFNAS